MIRIAAALALTVALGGCSTGARLTPEQAVGLIKAFGDAGCRGDVHFEAGAATGQMGGEAHVTASANGACDPTSRVPLLSATLPNG